MTRETDRPPTPEQRQEMIAIAAYYLAERRGFTPDGAESDWLSAERMINALIADQQIERATGYESGRVSIRNALLLHEDPMKVSNAI